MKKPPVDWWTFFAIGSLEPLHNLIRLSTGQNGFLNYEQACSAKGVMKITGEATLMENLTNRSKDLFVGLSPSLPIGLYKEAKRRKLPFIATGDNRYVAPSDQAVYEIALGPRFSQTQTYPMYIISDKEWLELYPHHKDAIVMRNKVMKACSGIKLQKASIFIPKKPKTLRQMCEEGAKAKRIDLKNQIYLNRMTYELKMIAKKNFEDYFYIIADIIKFAKGRMIVGPARGSSCGSLVCYLLDITAIDPIPYGLVFERFIDLNRDDLPDIDIDFSDTGRASVFEYVEKKYGADHVARLGTVGTFRARSALNAVGIGLRIPKWRIEKVSNAMIERSSGDARALQTIEDTFTTTGLGSELYKDYPGVMIAADMEGHPTNASQHAAGLIITKEPTEKYIAVDYRNHTIMGDKKDAETLNMLKIDMLGLTQLSIFERCIELYGDDPSSKYLETIPINDKKALEVLNKRYYSGIFQFNGAAVQSLAKNVHIDSINDIIVLTALARPGPLASGGAEQWVRRKNGQDITYPHPIFEPFLNDTLGVIVYQEQVMRIGREIGDLTWDDVTDLRKAMSKSLGTEFFDKYGDRWKKNAMKKGVEEDILVKVWDDMCAYGSWAFNKSHAVAYGTVSYWCCYLKAHHPLEFAAATLDAEKDVDRQIQTLRELRNEGIKYVPVDPKRSMDRWAIAGGKLIGPLSTIKGIGEVKMNDIILARTTGDRLPASTMKLLKNIKTEIDSLYPVRDAIKRLVPDLKVKKIYTKPTNVIDVQAGIKGEVMILVKIDRLAPMDENEPVRVARRGYAMKGPTAGLNFFVSDDTDAMFCKINRFNFRDMAQPMMDKARAGKSLYAIKGTVPPDFRMLKVDAVRYLGEIDK